MRQRSIGRWLAGLGVVALLVGLALGLGLGRPRAPAEARGAPIPRAGLERVGHIIVIYQENWSFDGLYGAFPGANGLANASATAAQVDRRPDLHGQPDSA